MVEPGSSGKRTAKKHSIKPTYVAGLLAILTWLVYYFGFEHELGIMFVKKQGREVFVGYWDKTSARVRLQLDCFPEKRTCEVRAFNSMQPWLYFKPSWEDTVILPEYAADYELVIPHLDTAR